MAFPAIMEVRELLQLPVPLLYVLGPAAVSLLWVLLKAGQQIWKAPMMSKSREPIITPSKQEKDALGGSDMGIIEPLSDFEWSTLEPKKIWKFNPKYFLTMGLQTTNINQIIHLDKQYLSRISARASIIESNPGALSCLPSAVPMAEELYTFLVTTYLPQRYPSIFQLSPESSHLINKLTGDHLPVIPPADTIEALRLLAVNIDQDFIMLLPSPDGDGYSPQAAVWCYPSGFKPHELLGQKLRDIHAPVPGYKTKLERSMDRFFGRLEVGKYVYRVNWSVTMTDTLYIDGGYHIHEGEEPENDSVDLLNCHVRCEFQILFALPKSGGRVLSVHTYLYPLQQIKDDGAAEQFCEAIDGLGKGNVPGIPRYKRAVIWGEKVKEFMRS